ncbi:MAG: hypothetical protein R2795_23350 [Saprospiraceae bacterium]
MKLYVTDANIFIDLFHADLLDAIPSAGLRLVTTAFVFDELEPIQQIALDALKNAGYLNVIEIDYNQLQNVDYPKGLSLPDKSVLCLASFQGARILTGDGLLRRTAEKLGIQTFGLLWLFNELVEIKIIEPSVAITKLLFLVEEKNSRKPMKAFQHLIDRWKQLK